MPQGPLSLHLFEWAAAGLRPLEWKQRLSIALDVARGVEYLHSLAQTSFIHRDLKPFNILLGDDMRAKVSDFELVKLAPDRKFSVETRLADTFGYLAPEYAGTHGMTPFHSIALDVSRGVEYLYNLAQTTFIHRDLKPSNILLGDDMRAKVSDFELVKLAPDGNFLLKPGWPALLVIWPLNTQWLKRKKKNALYEALEKLKAELMLLGFISLLLTVGAKPISMICISKKVGDTMLPCKTKDTVVESTAVESMKVDNGEEHGRKRLWESMSSEQNIPWRRVLAGAGEDSNYCSSANGNYPLVSPTGMNQLHIFIFLSAVLHVLYSVLTVALARAKMKHWKALEQETQTLEYEFSHG